MVSELPHLLPVSLRILLDESIVSNSSSPIGSSEIQTDGDSDGIISSGNGGKYGQLQFFVLQSLCRLAQLIHNSNACSNNNHTENILLKKNYNADALNLYSRVFMEDNIPAPSSQTSHNSISDSEENSGVIQKTYASSTSANTDSVSFYKDPYWTLLSKMKILPTISAILVHAAKVDGKEETHKSPSLLNLPHESIEVLCTLLTNLSYRSLGASAAIVDHEHIVPILLRTLEVIVPSAYKAISNENHTSGGAAVNPKAALPTLKLLCVLARQSRDIAQTKLFESLFTEDGCLQPILASLVPVNGVEYGGIDENQFVWAMQQQALELWRILLRYGLAIPYLSAILPHALPYVSSSTLAPSKHVSLLTSTYLSCFAVICQCARVATR
eukprot:CAMPEP_0194401686 /NCGR_PEP_ID=MMETSP0176-20130528/313_1 /TAXON_ID=216777 /ORGANISM="Proboscia alata, Strain PI-D3" /LENGTH=384 /DNA_ID=CAMNT_0039198537 /DNA_START=127 /DNA_END=1278 /DNA_ORIENTATION=+